MWKKEVSSTGRAPESCREQPADGTGPRKNPKWCPTLDTRSFRKERRVPCDVRGRVPSTARLSLAGGGDRVCPHPLHAKGWDSRSEALLPLCVTLLLPSENHGKQALRHAVPDISRVQGWPKLGPTKASRDHCVTLWLLVLGLAPTWL